MTTSIWLSPVDRLSVHPRLEGYGALVTVHGEQPGDLRLTLTLTDAQAVGLAKELAEYLRTCARVIVLAPVDQKA